MNYDLDIDERIAEEGSIPACPACGNDEPGAAKYLGALGRLDWFRCISCGWDFPAEVR